MSCHISHKGSSKTFFMYLVDPQDHILTVLWHYLPFWLKYKHFKNQGYKQGYKQEYKQGYAQWVIHAVLDVPYDISCHMSHFTNIALHTSLRHQTAVPEFLATIRTNERAT